MQKLLIAVALGFVLTPLDLVGQDTDAPNEAVEKPIKALMITGGCCHDYDRQKLIISKGISARANVVWTIVHQGGKSTNAKIPIYENPDWADGFDIVVHNECFAHVSDKEWVEKILRPHREGTPAILIHCAMHCYRTGDDAWFEFVGVQSPNHGRHYGFEVENFAPDHPIMKDFGKSWMTPKGELYNTIRLFPTAQPLARARRNNDKEPQVCIWTNQYGKGRVFGTTIGHYNEAMVDPVYLDMLTRGLLWATGRDESAFTKTDETTNEEIRKLVNIPVKGEVPKPKNGKCCNEGNLAFGQQATSSHEQKGNGNGNACDGDLGTRWAGQGGQPGQWWQVELAKAEHVRALRIDWEFKNTLYQYTVDASKDGKEWKTIVDYSANEKRRKIHPHKVDSPDTKFLRVNFLSASDNRWASIWEFEAYKEKKMPARIAK